MNVRSSRVGACRQLVVNERARVSQPLLVLLNGVLNVCSVGKTVVDCIKQQAHRNRNKCARVCLPE